MRKVVRDGKVAVLYSPGYGAGWYSWNTSHRECLFHPEIVALVEAERNAEIPEKADALFGDDFYSGGGRQLRIEWVPEGCGFRVDEYDGSESLVFQNEQDWVIA